MDNQPSQSITVEVLKGGFVVTYPKLDDKGAVSSYLREVCVTPRKLNQRLKEIIDSVSLVSD